MFIRFIVTTGHKSDTRCTGVVASLRILKESGLLPSYDEVFAEEAFEAINDKLPVPPFEQNNWNGCVCWFKDSAKEIISLFRDIVHILEQHDLTVRMLTENKPGMIVYEDEFQIVAKSKKY